MATKTINADMLYKMFLAGKQNIEARKEYINELNVFPVPDGDTGTNMSMTIMSAANSYSTGTSGYGSHNGRALSFLPGCHCAWSQR